MHSRPSFYVVLSRLVYELVFRWMCLWFTHIGCIYCHYDKHRLLYSLPNENLCLIFSLVWYESNSKSKLPMILWWKYKSIGKVWTVVTISLYGHTLVKYFPLVSAWEWDWAKLLPSTSIWATVHVECSSLLCPSPPLLYDWRYTWTKLAKFYRTNPIQILCMCFAFQWTWTVSMS